MKFAIIFVFFFIKPRLPPMTEEVKNVHREPHPFVGVPHMLNFVGRTIAFVGKIDRIEEGCLIMTTIERKYIFLRFN